MNLRPLSPFLVSFALLFACLGELRAGSAPVVRASHRLEREAALESLATQLIGYFRCEGELQLEFLRAWAEPKASSEPYRLVVTEYPSQLASNLAVRVRLESGATSLGEFSLTLRAQLWREAWVTRQPVEREAIFDPVLLDTRRVDALRERDVFFANAGDSDLTFARAQPAGKLLSWRDFSKRTRVRKGEVVEVSASEGALSISMKGLALQNGGVGDIVTVRNLESRKDISALVIADNRVQVRF